MASPMNQQIVCHGDFMAAVNISGGLFEMQKILHLIDFIDIFYVHGGNYDNQWSERIDAVRTGGMDIGREGLTPVKPLT